MNEVIQLMRPVHIDDVEDIIRKGLENLLSQIPRREEFTRANWNIEIDVFDEDGRRQHLVYRRGVNVLSGKALRVAAAAALLAAEPDPP